MFKKLLSYTRLNAITRAAAHKTLILGAAAVLSCLGGVAYAAQQQSGHATKSVSLAESSESAQAKESKEPSNAKESEQQDQAPQTGTPNSSTAASKAAKPTTPAPSASAYSISLSTYAITVEAGKQSQSVTASTSDGRKVAWMVAAPRGAQLYNNGVFGAPVSTYTFTLASGINALPGTYNIEVKAYLPSRSPKYTTTILKVTIVQARTFEVTSSSPWFTAQTSSYQAYVTYVIQRKNGHNAPVSVRASLGGCVPGVSVGHITPYGDGNSGFVFLSVTPPVAAGTCRVHVIANDGGYEAAKAIDVQFMD